MSSARSGAELFERRRRSERRRRWLRIAAGVATALVVGLVAWALLGSSWLAVRSVDVEGTRQLGVKQVRAAADVPIGRPLARLDTVAIETRIARLPVVESVEVSRSWPHTVTVEVTERTPVAWIRDDSGVRLVDRFGVAYRTVPRPPAGLVAITSDAADPRVRQQALEEAASVIEDLRESAPDLRRATRSVDADTKDAVTLRLTGNRVVVWGSARQAEAKLAVLEPLLKIRAAQYDVSAPEQPTTRR